MKLKDLTEHDHPEHCWTWLKAEIDFINKRVRTAYEEGFLDGEKHAVKSAVTRAITDPAAIREAFERDCG